MSADRVAARSASCWYVSVYANSVHAWTTIQGPWFDTDAQGETGGSRWSSTVASTSGFVVRHPAHY
jgi:hypothetical protein